MKKHLDVIMAMSKDHYFGKKNLDDMSWTGRTDKLIFKALTFYENTTLLCGPNTAELLPTLPKRRIKVIRKSRAGFYDTLNELYEEVSFKNLGKRKSGLEGAKLIGGPTLVQAAIEADLVRNAYITVIDKELKSGIGRELSYLHFDFCHYEELEFGSVKLRKYRV